MSNFGAESSPLTFAADLTELTRAKLAEAVEYVPFDEEQSAVAVQAGWFCVEPPIVSAQPLKGADAFSISYVGAQDSPGNANESASGVREMVIAARLFKNDQPYAFEAGVEAEGLNDYSILSGAYLLPTIVGQRAIYMATERLTYARSTLGNWEALALAQRNETVDARRLTASECGAVLEAVAKAEVDHKTLFRFLQETSHSAL